MFLDDRHGEVLRLVAWRTPDWEWRLESRLAYISFDVLDGQVGFGCGLVGAFDLCASKVGHV